MKKILTLFLFTLLTCYAQAQLFVDGQSMDEICKGHYLEICQISSFEKIRIAVDYGQLTPAFGTLPRLTDERNQPIRFNSITHALNVLYENGWELVSGYARENNERFLLERRKDKKEVN